ncbi:hypothetical protein L2734_18290 [Parashewanella spongiae]|uniref:hypothetical protein n=1 Tax=Parashewanella spongiae TaxID=342950 RepID=UPI001FB3AB3E|nr:hypothetical protein [Parashewanella spongiae]MCL1080079.1 hypothetical protein [Parashewanella spongiae]
MATDKIDNYQAQYSNFQLQEDVAAHVWSSACPSSEIVINNTRYRLSPSYEVIEGEDFYIESSSYTGGKCSGAYIPTVRSEISYFKVTKIYPGERHFELLEKVKDQFLTFFGLSVSQKIEKALLREGYRPTCGATSASLDNILRSSITRDALEMDTDRAFTQHNKRQPRPSTEFDIQINPSLNEMIACNIPKRQLEFNQHAATQKVSSLKSLPAASEEVSTIFKKSKIAYRCPISGEKLNADNAIHLTSDGKTLLLSRSGFRFIMIHGDKLKHLNIGLSRKQILGCTLSSVTEAHFKHQSTLVRLKAKLAKNHSVRFYGKTYKIYQDQKNEQKKNTKIETKRTDRASKPIITTPIEIGRDSETAAEKELPKVIPFPTASTDSILATSTSTTGDYSRSLKKVNSDIPDSFTPSITETIPTSLETDESDSGIECSYEESSPQLKPRSLPTPVAKNKLYQLQ